MIFFKKKLLFLKQIPGPAGLIFSDNILGSQPEKDLDSSEHLLPLCRNLYKLYKQPQVSVKSELTIREHKRTLRGPWRRLAETYKADDETIIEGLFGMNLKQAYETHPPDRPIPRIAVMIKSFERNETYIPNVTNRLVLFSDATGQMLGTVQNIILTEHFPVFVPNTVVVLKNVPIFNRSRFGKQLLVGRQCIEAIFPEIDEDDEERAKEKRKKKTERRTKKTAKNSNSSINDNNSTTYSPLSSSSFTSSSLPLSSLSSSSLTPCASSPVVSTNYSVEEDFNLLNHNLNINKNFYSEEEDDEDFETNAVPLKKKHFEENNNQNNLNTSTNLSSSNQIKLNNSNNNYAVLAQESSLDNTSNNIQLTPVTVNASQYPSLSSPVTEYEGTNSNNKTDEAMESKRFDSKKKLDINNSQSTTQFVFSFNQNNTRFSSQPSFSNLQGSSNQSASVFHSRQNNPQDDDLYILDDEIDSDSNENKNNLSTEEDLTVNEKQCINSENQSSPTRKKTESNNVETNSYVPSRNNLQKFLSDNTSRSNDIISTASVLK